MSVEHRGSKAAEVSPIYRSGDRVVVELSTGFYEMIIQEYEIIDGELWLYGKGKGFGTSFPAKSIVDRLKPNQVFTWPKLK